MKTTILLVDDHKIIRDGLRALIEKEPNMEVVADACDGRAAVRKARELMPHIIIMDISMSDMNGIEATRQIISNSSGTKIIALSMHADRSFVINMLEAGAAGYLLKDCASEELTKAIKTVLSGKTYLSPAIAGVAVKNAMRHSGQRDSHTRIELTAREREVLQLLAKGHTTKRIAAQLGISVKTIETHRRQVMKKLDAHSVAELTKYAVREGLPIADV